jgi:hypothetical protein
LKYRERALMYTQWNPVVGPRAAPPSTRPFIFLYTHTHTDIQTHKHTPAEIIARSTGPGINVCHFYEPPTSQVAPAEATFSTPYLYTLSPILSLKYNNLSTAGNPPSKSPPPLNYHGGKFIVGGNIGGPRVSLKKNPIH